MTMQIASNLLTSPPSSQPTLHMTASTHPLSRFSLHNIAPFASYPSLNNTARPAMLHRHTHHPRLLHPPAFIQVRAALNIQYHWRRYNDNTRPYAHVAI